MQDRAMVRRSGSGSQAADRAIERMVLDASVWVASLFVALSLMAHEAMARDVPPAYDSQWAAECGSCHVAYPPRLLAAAEWRRIMLRLDRHYGVDASIEAPAATRIGAFLERNAGSDRRASDSAPEPRISRTAWFTREHREVPASTWLHPAVKSASNCAACHLAAAQGDFRERNIQLPR